MTMEFIARVPLIVGSLALVFFVFRSRLSLKAKLIWPLVIAAASSKYYFFRRFGGHMFNPELPELLVCAYDWFCASVMFLGLLSVVCLFRFRGKKIILPLVAGLLAAYGLWEGIRLPQVSEATFDYADLPSELDGYRIVAVSDLHCSSSARRWRTQAVVDLVNAQQGDLVCLVGDFVDGYVTKRLEDIRPLVDIHAPDGVFAVAGNHEFYRDSLNWRAAYARLGIRFLDNECAFPRRSLALGGVPDRDGFKYANHQPPDVRQAFVAATNGEFRILMKHRPEDAQANAREVGVRLQLSGHTHGGIVRFFRPYVANKNNGFVLGVYDFGASKLLVSSGCGQWAGFPIRLWNRSEINVVTLRRK